MRLPFRTAQSVRELADFVRETSITRTFSSTCCTAHRDVVDHLRHVIGGQLHDLADMLRLIDEALEHKALAITKDLDR